jgi:DNA-binding FadR family transcriptional regulator
MEQLREAIRELETQNYVNEQHMRTCVVQVADHLKPVNLLKQGIAHLFSGDHETRTSLLRMLAGIATSFLVRKFFRKGLKAR